MIVSKSPNVDKCIKTLWYTRFCKNTNHSIMLTTDFSEKWSGSFFYKFRNRTFNKCPKSVLKS